MNNITVLALLVFIFLVGWLGYQVIKTIPQSQWPQTVQIETENAEYDVVILVENVDDTTMKYGIKNVHPLGSYNKTLCLNGLSAYTFSPISTILIGQVGEFSSIIFDDPICSYFLPASKAEQPSSSLSIIRRTHFYQYPFDKMDIVLTVTILGTDIEDNKGVCIPVNIEWEAYFPNWEVTSIRTFQARRGCTETALLMELQRPHLYRILTPILLTCLLIFIFMIIFIKDLGNFAQVTIGMLFGIWSIRQVIIPANIKQPTILDPIFLCFYMVLAISILFRLTIVPLLQKSSLEREQTNEEFLSSLLSNDTSNKSYMNYIISQIRKARFAAIRFFVTSRIRTHKDTDNHSDPDDL